MRRDDRVVCGDDIGLLDLVPPPMIALFGREALATGDHPSRRKQRNLAGNEPQNQREAR
jgi:hypothetical protein